MIYRTSRDKMQRKANAQQRFVFLLMIDKEKMRTELDMASNETGNCLCSSRRDVAAIATTRDDTGISSSSSLAIWKKR